MKINILNIKDGEYPISFSVSSEELEINDYKFDSDIEINVKMIKSSSQILMEIYTYGVLNTQCDWCLDNIRFEVRNNFTMIYLYERQIHQKEEYEEDDNLKYISLHQPEIDIKNDVRDYVLLSIPMRTVPEEKDGICTYCKRNVYEIYSFKKNNENPVWEKLKKLKQKK